MEYTLRTISTYSGLLPMVTGVFLWRYRVFRPVVIFLLIGFVNDLVTSNTEKDTLANFSMSVYSFFDILFLLWFTTRIHSVSTWIKIVSTFTLFAIWFWAYDMSQPLHVQYSEGSRYFDPFFLTSIAILAAYGLIKIIESPLRKDWQGYFGFYIGIFIYCFSIFFNHLFVTEEIKEEFWDMNALLNIMTMLIYTWAFLRLRKLQ